MAPKKIRDIHRAKFSIQSTAFCFQETNIKLNILSRQTNLRASGIVATFVNNLINSNEIITPSPLEVIAVSIQLKNPICFCNIYLPDSTNLSLNDLNHIIQQLPKTFIFLGDFNSRNQI